MSNSLLRIKNYLKHDLAILGSIAAIPNETLPQLIQNMPYNSILLIEDIDHLFESSGNTNMTKKVTMSGLLNTMDGLQSRSGCSKSYNIIESLKTKFIDTYLFYFSLYSGFHDV
jgi:hypothetical protein